MQLISKQVKGLTLLEVLVTSIILGFVLSGTAIFLRTNSRLNNEGLADAFLQTNLNNFLTTLKTDIRNGNNLTFSTDKKTLTIKTKSGGTTVWKHDDSSKTLSRNGKEYELIGADKAEIDCDFEGLSVQSVNIKLKMKIYKGKDFFSTTGDNFIDYRFSCRNVSYEES